MQIRKVKFIDKNKVLNFGRISFNLGGFFLPSALPISLIFFIFAILSSIYIHKPSIYKDKWNFTLLITSALMIISSLKGYLIQPSISIGFDKTEIFINLFNWIPLFLLFATIKIYLKNNDDRKRFLKFLLTGSVPVIISCFLQKWFNFYGPYETFQGLIVWFNKQLYEGDGISGLFSNQNYAGFWLSTIFPLSLGIYFSQKRTLLKNSFILAFIVVTFYLTLLTYSRNAVLGLFSSLFLILGIKIILKIFVFFLIILTLLYSINIIFSGVFVNAFETFLPINIITKFIQFDFINLKKWTRIEIWSESIKLILSKPLLGFAAMPFSLFFISEYNFGHIHNMPLQLAFDYGIPLSIILTGFVSVLLIKSWVNILGKNIQAQYTAQFLDKCWLVGSLVAVLSHLNDISYYDGKISILIWILFAGLVSINNEKKLVSKDSLR